MLLRTEKLKKTFGGLIAVNEIDFCIDAGRIAAIIGPNGSGKTTFFNVVSGILPATGGKIFFNDQDVTSRKAHEMTALGMARTFQNIRLFANLTARDNIILGRYSQTHSGLLDGLFNTPRLQRERRESEIKAAELLAFVGLEKMADHMAKNLPYGAQRRLEIARALASEPKLLLLDEPAAGLNIYETAEVARLIRRIRDMGITVLLVEHDMSLVMDISDEIVVLSFGRTIAEDRPEAIQQHPEVIRIYLGADDEPAETAGATGKAAAPC